MVELYQLNGGSGLGIKLN